MIAWIILSARNSKFCSAKKAKNPVQQAAHSMVLSADTFLPDHDVKNIWAYWEAWFLLDSL
jgi:predicted lipoprotein